MPAGDASMDGQRHDLYAQAEATRQQSRLLAAELRASLLKTSQNWQLISATWDQAEQIRKQRQQRLTDPDRLRRSAYARLQAQLASMPVIEQAKGIMMVKYGWTEDQAFEAMRRASQRENIKLRELAVRIVAGAAGQAPAPRTAHPAATNARIGRRTSPGQIPAAPRTTSEHRHNCQAHG
jgi:ANTAR domain